MSPVTSATRSLWHDTGPGPVPARPPLAGDTAADVAVVGAGYTGLWTAYYLLAADPHLRVVVIDREQVGFGASSRNGGWCIGELAAGADRLASIAGPDAARRQIRAMADTVTEVGRVVAAEAIDCHWHQGGAVYLARNHGQLARLDTLVAEARHWGLGDDDVRRLGADAARARVGATRVLGGAHIRHCAAFHPARLVTGLADAVERRRGRIHEGTAAVALEPGVVRTTSGTVRAEIVVRATEGYTPGLAGHRRALVPLSSSMIATEPLDQGHWDRLGLGARETFADLRHLVIYGQRTADDRLAFGARGAPYRFASRIRVADEHDQRVSDAVHVCLLDLFPDLAEVAITHRWGGVLGVPRDWTPSVGFDPVTGSAWAGGYVGEGVAAANLAGRTLADLVLGRVSPLTELAWVGHRSRRWEPEPLRWLGVNAALKLMAAADRSEARRGRPSHLATWLWRTVIR